MLFSTSYVLATSALATSDIKPMAIGCHAVALVNLLSPRVSLNPIFQQVGASRCTKLFHLLSHNGIFETSSVLHGANQLA